MGSECVFFIGLRRLALTFLGVVLAYYGVALCRAVSYRTVIEGHAWKAQSLSSSVLSTWLCFRSEGEHASFGHALFIGVRA